jgi:asparagine synthase (glutamine-hydrolysing)
VCGIFGIAAPAAPDPAILARAEQLQRHRGPDAQHRTIERLGRLHVGLAHQRLAIIDLSPAGEQPMRSPSGRSLVMHNGEIYNYRELRVELEAAGVRFATHTDTEVIAAACELWGVEAALRKMNGMWAFAWLDFPNARLVLARDRFGKKPLYLARGAHGLAFASEMKTLLRALPLRSRVNMQAVASYLGASQLDCDERATFLSEIEKLPAASYAELDASGPDLSLKIRRYWRLDAAEPLQISFAAAAEQVSELLDDAVRLRLRSDVPLGILLSGGLDSSAVAASAARQLGGAELVSISAVSNDKASDESPFSRHVVRHLGLAPREVQLEFDAGQLLGLIADVSAQNDEPIGGFACVAQSLLMRRARDLGITVLLSGQGADEAFCGYRKYVGFEVLARLRARQPWAALQLLGGFLWRGTLFAKLSPADAARYLPRWLRTTLPALRGPATRDLPLPELGLNGSDVRARQRADLEHYSVPALTHWEDRSSMASSREVRDPFLDYRLVELGVRLPMHFKMQRGYTKYVLRHAVERRLPPEIVWRRDKRGFATPEARFLAGPLRSTLEGLADADAFIIRTGMVDATAARARLSEFLARPGARVPSREIFQLLSLELWLRAYADVLSL